MYQPRVCDPGLREPEELQPAQSLEMHLARSTTGIKTSRQCCSLCDAVVATSFEVSTPWSCQRWQARCGRCSLSLSWSFPGQSSKPPLCLR